MLTVTPTARDYFAKLLEEQPEGTQLRLSTRNPGTPAADVTLNFCPMGEQHADDEAVDCGVFTLFVSEESKDALSGAMIDFETNATGGELSIRAPGLKGQAPDDDAPLHERVSWVLESRINPMVASHGGVVSLVDVTDENDVILRFGGGCHGCGMVDVTLRQGIETQLRELVPEIRNVTDGTDHATGENPYYA
ncbi:MAG: NifU family protein [Wenzhouxiangellaceae bacterium]|jgi:Fe/S biogenesis protein NfuA|nr:NifU family protein [Wenzhouxiangellaceae bacterium]MBS3746180.1 NifU family protein [Wenzhouxiangellaceae bacterium]MBS3822608.1 NifU family protein [Wenzhouxiangellaceae bacterium]